MALWVFLPKNCIGSTSSNDSTFVVARILIAGNQITKQKVIERELMFKQGDSIDVAIWSKLLSRSRENIMNLGIFNFVDVTSVLDSAQGYTVLVNVVERWYILPLPRLELVDRNFNEWVRSGDIGRFNYGMDLNWSNFRGMNETLKFQFKWGYTRRFALSYQIPFLNENQQEGLSFSGSYTTSKEVGYDVDDSKLKLYQSGSGFARTEFSTGLRYSRRKGYFNTSFLGVEYRKIRLDDIISKLNPEYLFNSSSDQQLLAVSWGFRRDLRDYKYYPLGGYLLDLEAVKSGWGIQENEPEWMFLSANYRKYGQIAPKWHYAYSLKGKLSGQSDNPFWIQRGFGYGSDLVRGYEYYVIPGQNFALFKSNIKFTLMKTKVVSLPLPISDKFKNIPNAFYLNAGFETGYVRDRQFAYKNPLSNRIEYGYGIGFDYVTYYNLVFCVEYSINRLGESGFFLHFATPI